MKLVEPRRHHGGRRLSLADPAALRGPGGGASWAMRGSCSCSRTAGLTDARLFQGKDSDPVRPGRRYRRRRGAPASHGAAFDKIITFDMGGTSTDVAHYDWRIRARLRDTGGRGTHACAHDAHPHRGGRRRLDPALRRAHATGSGPESAGRQPGPRLLSPRRAAGGHRLQRVARKDKRRAFSTGVRPRRRPAHRCRRGARKVPSLDGTRQPGRRRET